MNSKKNLTCQYSVEFKHLGKTLECKNEIEQHYFEIIKDDSSIIDVRRIDNMWNGNNFDGEDTVSTFIVFRGFTPEAVIVAASADLTKGEIKTIEYLHNYFHSVSLDVTLVSIDDIEINSSSENSAFKFEFSELIRNESKVNIIH